MISTSGILSTGEKKCRPMKSAGRSTPWASSVIGRVEVLEHSSASSLTNGMISANTLASRAGSSKTASYGVRTTPPDGINLWLPVHDERAALLHLAASGIRVAAGTPFLETGSASTPHVRVASGLVTGEHVDEVAAASAGAVSR